MPVDVWSVDGSDGANIVIPAPSNSALFAKFAPDVNVFSPLNVCDPDKWAVSASRYAEATAVPCQVPVPMVPTVAIDE